MNWTAAKSAGLLTAFLMLCAAASPAQAVIKSDWPKDKIPADIAVFPYAGVTDHGPSAEGYWIKVADGKAADFAKYATLMASGGWVRETRGSFEFLKKGDETVEIRRFPDENLGMLIVSVFKPPREWPSKDYPELPEPKRGSYTYNTDPDSGTIITISRVSEAEFVEYFRQLVATGWKGVPEELQLTRSSPRKLELYAGQNGDDEWSLMITNQ